jgi:hypothetical protein
VSDPIFLKSPYQPIIDGAGLPPEAVRTVKPITVDDAEPDQATEQDQDQPDVASPAAYSKTDKLTPPPELRPLFEGTAAHFKVPVNVLMALVHQESRYNPNAKNAETGASGMAQYIGATAKSLGINPDDPNEAIPAAAMQLRQRLDQGLSIEDAVKEHFAGPDRKLWGPKTAAYGKEVMGKARAIGEQLYGDTADDTPAPAAAPGKVIDLGEVDPSTNLAGAPNLSPENPVEEVPSMPTIGASQNKFAPGAMSRDEYKRNFLAVNPHASLPAVNAALAQYDQQQAATSAATAKARTNPAGPTPLPSTDEFFQRRLDAKLAAKNPQAGGIAPNLNADMPLEHPKAPAPTPSMFDTVATNFVGGALNTGIGIGAAALDIAGDKEGAKEWDQGRAQVQSVMDERGGDSLPGRAANLAGSIALAGAGGGAGRAVELATNAGMFGVPAFRDTYNAQKANGASEDVAIEHALAAAGINTALPMIAPGGSRAVTKLLGGADAAGMRAAGIQLGQAAGEGAGFSVANTASHKAIDAANGIQNDQSFNPGDIAKDAAAFALLRGAHMVPHAAGAAADAALDRVAPGIQAGRAMQAGAADLNFDPASAQAEAARRLAPENYNPNTITPQESARQPGDVGPAPTKRTVPMQQDQAAPPVSPAPAPADIPAQAGSRIEPDLSTPDEAPAPQQAVPANPGTPSTADKLRAIRGAADGVPIVPAVPDGPLTASLHAAAADHDVNPAPLPVMPQAEPAPPALDTLPMDDLRAQLKQVATQQQAADPATRKQLQARRKEIESAINAKGTQAKADSRPAEEPLSTGPFEDMKQANKMMVRHAEETGAPHQVVPSADGFRVQRIGGGDGIDTAGAAGGVDGRGRSGRPAGDDGAPDGAGAGRTGGAPGAGEQRYLADPRSAHAADDRVHATDPADSASTVTPAKLTLYHGTRAKFDAFDPDRSGGMVSFAESPDVATKYATGGGGAREAMTRENTLIFGEDGTAYRIQGEQAAPIGRWDQDKLPNAQAVKPFADGEQRPAAMTVDQARQRVHDGLATVVPHDSRIVEGDLHGASLLDTTTPEGVAVIAKLTPTNRVMRSLVDSAKMDAQQGDTAQFNTNFWGATKRAGVHADQLRDGIIKAMKDAGYDGIRFVDDGHTSVGLFDTGLSKLKTKEPAAHVPEPEKVPEKAPAARREESAKPAAAGSDAARAGGKKPAPTKAGATLSEARAMHARQEEVVRQAAENIARRKAEKEAAQAAAAPQPAAAEAPAPMKPATTAGERIRAKMKAENPFMAFLSEHGIHVDERSDTGAEKARHVMVPGYGNLYRKAGLRIDELAGLAHEAGFLSDRDMADPTDNGGTRKLADMIERAAHRKEVIGRATEAEPAGPSADEHLLAEAEKLGIDVKGKSADQVYDEVHAAHADDFSNNEAHLVHEAMRDADIPLDGGKSFDNLSDEDIDAIFGIKPKAAGARETGGQDQGAASDAARGRDEEAGASRAREGNDRPNDERADGVRPAAAGAGPDGGRLDSGRLDGIGGSDGSEREFLKNYTPDEIRAHEEAQEAIAKAADTEAAKQDAARKKERDQKDIAARQDASADDFQLGQDAHDSLAGQKDIFGGAQFSTDHPMAKEAAHEVEPLLRDLADKGAIVLHDDASTLPIKGDAPDGVQALTAPDGTIHVVADALHGNAMGVVLHEAFHAGARPLLGTKAWSDLEQRLGSLYRQGEQSTGAARAFFDKARERVAVAKARGAVAPGMEAEEFGAYAIEEHANAPASVRKWVDDLTGAVKAWALRRFGRQLGQVTPAQLSSLAKLALMDKVSARAESSKPAFSADSRKTVQVDGQRRPIENSNGKLIAQDMHKQMAFWRWAKDTKVVDEQGRPKVVFHGTNVDFAHFDESKVGSSWDAGKLGKGFYFSTDPRLSGSYAMNARAKTRDDAAHVMPVYLRIEHPLEIGPLDFKAGENLWDKLRDFSEQAGIDIDPVSDPSSNQPNPAWSEPFRDALKRFGYDGVKLNFSDGHQELVAFDPEQVKSATGNDGSFDASNPDIRYSVGAPATPTAPVPMRERLAKMLKEPVDELRSVAHDVAVRVVPMAVGGNEARAIAKDFANQTRQAQAQWHAFDKVLREDFTTDQLENMWNAADQENDLRREGKTSTTEGLASLPADQREVVELLHSYGEQLWDRAKKVGLVDENSTGVHYWTPRVAANIYADGSVDRITAPAGEVSKDATNLRTSASSTKQRKYETTAESEAALQTKHGADAAYVKNIRVMPLAMAQLEKAIAGRSLVNQVKAFGQLSGADLISDRKLGKNYDTFDHPALKRYIPRSDWQDVDQAALAQKGYIVRADGVYRADGSKLSSYRVDAGGAVQKLGPVLDSDGKPDLIAVPLFVHKDFLGPLRSVLKTESPLWYQHAMRLKGGITSMIMVSPLTHNMVIWGKAMPTMAVTMGWKNNAKNIATAGLNAYVVGYQTRQNHALMKELIGAGLVPVSGRGMSEDVQSIARGIEPGQSWTAQALGKVGDLAGKGDAVRRGVDKAGEFWHETMLWNRVADMQAGMASMMRTSLMDKGFDQDTANRIAAHFANRYAGMVPQEAMSQGAHMMANLMLFSKSFNLTNMGSFKDATKGLPGDVQAQILRNVKASSMAAGMSDSEATQAARKMLGKAQATVRVKGGAVIAMDIAAMTFITSLVQALWQGQNGKQIAEDFKERTAALGRRIQEDPLKVAMQPLQALASLSQTADNAPGKEDRVRIGEDEKRGDSYYARLPVGKIGEELKNYMNFVSAMRMAHGKMSTFAKPFADLFGGNKDFQGQSIVDEHGNGFKQAAQFGAYWVKSQLPTEDIMSLVRVANGTADQMDKDKLLGTATGITVGRVAGGDAVAEMRDQARQTQASLSNALPGAKEAIRRGDIEGAEKLLIDAGQTPHEAQRILLSLQNPNMITNGKMKKFIQHASPEEIAKFQKMTQRK